MMSTRVLGMAPAIRRFTFSSNLMRNHVVRGAGLKRGVQTQSLPPTAMADLLNAQRVKRPNSPHMTIYQPQLTWIASIVHRGTGVGLSVLLYGFALSYVALPAVGLPFSSADVVGLVATLPVGVKYAAKAVLAAPFTFHFFNGIRHLIWDTGRLMTLKGAYASGYTVIAATALSTGALLSM